jgi:asparagine synthase (glutamine-hydrolysing)
MIREKAQALLALLESSVENCLAGPGPHALQLSGGLDSAIIQAIGGLDRLYCCTWPEFDNLTAAAKAAGGRGITTVTFSRGEMLEVALPEVARLTEGKGTWSQCCQWFLARAMARDGVVVEVNGEGADELFHGYARYRVLWWLEQMAVDPHLAEYGGIIRTVLAAERFGQDWRQEAAARLLGRTRCWERAVVLAAQNTGATLVDTCAAVDEADGLQSLIDAERTVAAAHGLEHRWPFMDPRVVVFAHQLAPADKVTFRESKHALREVARHLGIHPDIVDEQTKRGLVVPPTWAPKDAPRWSRGWFDQAMADAWARQQQQERAA